MIGKLSTMNIIGFDNHDLPNKHDVCHNVSF